MSSSVRDSAAVSVSVTATAVTVGLRDGRTISAPLAWFPRLAAATEEERADWRLIGDGNGVRWPRVDEDLSVAGLLRAG